jgi:hypothetical protein
MMRMPRALAALRMGEMWPPHRVKMEGTPWASSASATRSPPWRVEEGYGVFVGMER